MSVKNYVASFKNYQFDFSAITNTRNIINSATFTVLCCMQHKIGTDSCTANARKPARFGRHRITDWRENALRRSFTVWCQAPVRGVPGVRSAIGSVVFAKMQNGASYASRSTRTSFAPLRRCRGTPIDGSGCTSNAVHWSASMPGSVATFSWSDTICEDLKPCRCGVP